jgi:hypothetical protein
MLNGIPSSSGSELLRPHRERSVAGERTAGRSYADQSTRRSIWNRCDNRTVRCHTDLRGRSVKCHRRAPLQIVSHDHNQRPHLAGCGIRFHKPGEVHRQAEERPVIAGSARGAISNGRPYRDRHLSRFPNPDGGLRMGRQPARNVLGEPLSYV